MNKITSVRVLLASINNWYLHQLDIDNVFLHGYLHEDVYMELPSSMTAKSRNQVFKLIKSLYGLKQTNKSCHEKLFTTLAKAGLIQARSDHSLFIKHKGQSVTTLVKYVDDIILG